MRVLVLGGAGEVGRAAARVLGADAEVDQVVIADLAADRARAVAAELGEKATAVAVDVTDHAALVARMREADVVVNTVGPYFRFGPGVLRAAIDAGRDYVDVCDDPAPTVTMLDMRAEAEAAGITAVLGIGASPGLANLLAAHALAGLDRAETVITGWNLAMAQPESRSWRPSAAVVHGIEQVSNTIPVIRGGEQVWERPLRRTVVEYPGLGRATGWTFGHPEPVTLARAFPDIRESVNLALAPRYVAGVLTLLGRGVTHGVLSRASAASVAALAENLLPSGSVGLLAGSTLPPLFALATGERDGAPATVACALGQVPGLTMAEVTGIPLAVGALMRAQRPGVHPPEAVFTPDEFFRRLAPHCVGRPTPESLAVVTASYESEAANAEALQRGSLITALLAGR
ncbi:saccharopine dehydrogenase NADP-binding domain-containing protein [Nocardia puris]|uniref:saccharopine dehydrogenase NADP-binding domain-containing protein n=1 Tax=Nocardia puris TaxID=208602 RepID=UPI0018932C58|nr:saccharopine dehydrogenase NADP-binding domain-containing protein [Nocardia puris]MBF6211669.1 saccharopine dehydrogenase NADP-binding domain-containing protein [Nocardia puris]MBF6365673.1 saccharopine dehydrogenase NADP-binding domain-containing protein [Nocardia puris]MBF6460685.1 saccharopine dehydrogenase NADP-binding domain-containing protein [Nocardia puris]